MRVNGLREHMHYKAEANTERVNSSESVGRLGIASGVIAGDR